MGRNGAISEISSAAANAPLSCCHLPAWLASAFSLAAFHARRSRTAFRRLAHAVAPVRLLRPKRSILLSLRSAEPSISDADDTALGLSTQAKWSFAGASSFGRRQAARVRRMSGQSDRAAPIRKRVPTASFTNHRRRGSRTRGSANWTRVWILNCIGIDVKRAGAFGSFQTKPNDRIFHDFRVQWRAAPVPVTALQASFRALVGQSAYVAGSESFKVTD